MKTALERHEAGSALVIPIILRPCDWQQLPIANLQALPKNGTPVTTWNNMDEAFTCAAQGVRSAVDATIVKRQPAKTAEVREVEQSSAKPVSIRPAATRCASNSAAQPSANFNGAYGPAGELGYEFGKWLKSLFEKS